MKKKNYNPTFNKFTNNKVILYVVASIALLSLFGHLMYSEFSAIILFFLIKIFQIQHLLDFYMLEIIKINYFLNGGSKYSIPK